MVNAIVFDFDGVLVDSYSCLPKIYETIAREIGIKDLSKPDFGDAVEIRRGETPIFWACGVTPQEALLNARPDICITHSPGHMFVSDKFNEEFATS